MFSFGEFYNLAEGKVNYSVWELIMFIILGSLGGLIGATFNGLNRRLTLWRRRNITSNRSQTFEVLLITFCMSCVTFWVPFFWNRCNARPKEDELQVGYASPRLLHLFQSDPESHRAPRPSRSTVLGGFHHVMHPTT